MMNTEALHSAPTPATTPKVPLKPQTRYIRPPRSLADIDSKNEDIVSATMLETCCVYLCAGELYMVGYRENDLDDVTDMDGLLQKAEPLTLESIVHPPRVIQSYILDCTTSPLLSKYDACLLLTYEYSVLFCAKGNSLSEFHFSEIFESYFTEEEMDRFTRQKQQDDENQGNNNNPDASSSSSTSPIVMHIHESTGMLIVIAQGTVLILSLDLDWILDNIEYFASDEASERLHEMNNMEEGGEVGEADGDGTEFGDANDENNGGATTLGMGGAFDFGKCVRGATLVDMSGWMLLAPDPTSMSRLPVATNSMTFAHVPAPMFQSRTETCAIWCWETVNSPGGITECTLICSGNGNWLEFLPLIRESGTHTWLQKHNPIEKQPGYNPIDSRISASKRAIQPRITDHTAWVTSISSGEGMSIGCTGDALGCIVVWQAVAHMDIGALKQEKATTKGDKNVLSSNAATALSDMERGGDRGRVDTVIGDGEEAVAENAHTQDEKSVDTNTNTVDMDIIETGYRKLFKFTYNVNHAITAIVRVEKKHAFWIGDTSGSLTYVSLMPSNAKYQLVTRVSVLNPGSLPTRVAWLPTIVDKQDYYNLTNMTVGEANGRLRFMCLEAGMAVEAQVQHCSCIFNASAGPSFAPSHRSIVEVVAVLLELELLITAGSSHNVQFWNLDTCELELTIVSPDLYITSIGAFDGGYVQGGCARVLLGHANGNVHDYVLSEIEEVLAEGASVSGSHADEIRGGGNKQDGEGSIRSGNRAGQASLMKGVVTNVDILDTLMNANDDEEVGSIAAADGGERSRTGTHSKKDGSQQAGSQEPSTKLGHQLDETSADRRDSSNNQVLIDAGRIVHAGYSATLTATYSHCPLPVTSILYSTLGLYFSFCYALQNIIIHDWEKNAVSLQLELDQVLVSVSTLQSYEMEDVHEDSLVLALHGVQGIKFLDALNRQFIEPLTLSAQGKPLQACALWSTQGGLDQPADMRQVRGIFVEYGMNAYVVEDDKLLKGVYYDAINNPRRYSEGDGDSLDNVVMGVVGLSETKAPWVPLWGLRKAIMLRMQNTKVLKTIEYAISNDKCRFVYISTLKTSHNIRANRVIVVTSDGTCVVLHL